MSDINVTSCKTPKILVDVCTGPQGPSGPPGPPATLLEWNYYPVAGQTALTGIDASGQEPMVFNPESVQVFGNGVMLEKTNDYVVVGDHTIELQQPALGGGDVYTILSQVPPVDYDPTQDTINLQLQINANADAITDLDGRVTKNESDIADLQAQHTGNLTTQNIGTVGPNPFGTRSLDTQYDVNWAISDRLDENKAAIDGNAVEITTLSNIVVGLSSDLQDVEDDLVALGGRVTINEISIAGNANDIVSLQDQINNLPAPPDVTPIVDDLASLEIRVGAAEGDIIDLRKDVDALGAPVDLTPLENRVGVLETQVSANTNSIGSLTATVNGHTTTLNSHGTRLTKLEATVVDLEFEHADLAYTNVDNSFTVAQTIQSGVTLRGSDAHIYADTGTPVAFWNNNQFNPVISILRSNKIDVALTLNADGSILGVKDVNDDASAVSKKYVDDAVGSVDLTDYAKQDDLDQEIQERKDGDADLQSQIDYLSASGGYNDAWIEPSIDAGDAATLSEANAYTDAAVANVTVDLTGYAKTDYVDSGDEALQLQIDALSASGGYNDAWIQPAIDAGDNSTLTAANAYADSLFGNVTHPDLTGFETILKSEADDAATLNSAIAYADTLFSNVTHPDPPNLAPYATIAYSDAGDNKTLTSANAYADTLFGNVTHPDPPNLAPYATIAYSDAGDSTTLNSSKAYTDAAIGNITHPAPPDVTGFVKKTGGDSMEGPLFIHVQKGNADQRADRRVVTLGVFSNSDGSALRLGTTRDRVYVGHNDTSFNGPIRVNEIEEKDAGRGTSFANLIRADDDILHTPTDVSFTDLIDQTEQNKQDIVSLSQLYSDVSHTKMAGRYRHMSTPSPRDGELTIQDGSYTNSGTTVVHMHRKDLNGIVNTGADIDPGDVLEILNVADEGLGVFEVISSSTSGDVINVTVAHVRGYRVPVVGSECRIRLINIADIDVGIDDLDDRYLQVAGDTATGPMVFDGTVETKKMVKVQRPTASGTAGDGFTLYGRLAGSTNVGQKILATYHNSDSTGDAVNYYGKESASTNIMSRSGINSLITGKGYATEAYVDGKGYATEDYVDGKIPGAPSNASNSVSGISKLGQVQRGSGPASGGLSAGCLFYDYVNKILYIGG